MWSRHAYWVLASFSWLLSGCDSQQEDVPPAVPIDASVDAAVILPPFELEIYSDVQAGELGPLEPLRLLATEADGRTIELGLPNTGRDWPRRFDLPSLPDGQWQLTVYYDRNENRRLDACPFPPRPEHVEQADRSDNIVGTQTVRIYRGGSAELHLDRRICGPGQLETGVRGTVQIAAPEGVEAPVFMLVQSLDGQPDLDPDDGRSAPEQAPIRVPLLPNGLVDTGAFSVGELLPGDHRLTFFVDSDGDAAPTPCQPEGLGGGDQYVAVLDTVEIVAGERLELAPIVLERRDCPEAPVGIKGSLHLSGDLEAALAEQPELTDSWGVLDGSVRLGLFDDIGLRHSMQIAGSVVERSGPIPFTVTGVPEGRWRVVAWLDRDSDQAFAPCGALNGAEVVWASVDDVSPSAEILDLGMLELRASACPPLSGVFGTLSAQWEQGSAGSGRPVRVDLVRLDDRDERRSLPLFESHRELPVTAGRTAAPFAITGELSPGQYEATFYVDTNRDGAFQSCEAVAFGDRAATAPFTVEVREGQMLPIGSDALVEVTTLPCEPPGTTVRPMVDLSALTEAQRSAAGGLRVQLTERGGWRNDQLLALSFAALEGDLYDQTLINIAPGEYNVTVYTDTNGDEQFGACGDAAEDRLLGSVDLVVNEAAPHPQPQVVLGPSCGQ